MNEVKSILDKYDLPEAHPVKLVRESSDNKVYVVGDARRSVLRLSKRLSADDVQFEYDCSQHLTVSGIPIAPWILCADGTISAIADDGSVATVFGFVEGKHIVIDKENQATVRHAFAAGKVLGEIARVGRKFKTTSKRARTVFTELERVLVHSERFVRIFDNGKEFVEDVERIISFARQSDSPIGLIHNDFRAGNVLFSSADSVVAVLDFDWCCTGPLMKDVALGALEWSFPDGANEYNPAIFDAFLGGYFSECDEGGERADLYRWVQFAALSDAATYFCDSLDELELNKTVLSSYMYKKFKYFSNL